MELKELKCISENIDLDMYIKFREEVKKHMEYPEWLWDFSKEDLEDLLKNGSKIWVYYLNNEEVCSMMSIPSTKKSIDKFKLDIDYRDVIDYGPMFVNIEYVGNRLQFQMLKELDKYFMNRYKYVIATIHPDNMFSINNILKDDFIYKSTQEFKRGTRNIYLKEYKDEI